MSESIKDIINGFDIQQTLPLSEGEVFTRLIAASKYLSVQSQEDSAEILAFSFIERDDSVADPGEELLNWNTLLAPGDATIDQRSIPDETLLHWKIRAEQSQHLVMTSRYLTLIWQFEKRESGGRPPVLVGEKLVHTNMEIIRKKLYKTERYGIIKLQKAAAVARVLNTESLYQDLKLCILDYVRQIPLSEIRNIWSPAYDMLIKGRYKNVTEAEKDQIIIDMEGRLQTLKALDPWAAEAVAVKLADYYRACGRRSDVARIMAFLGEAYDKYLINAAPIQVTAQLQRLYRIYMSYQTSDLARSLVPRIQEADRASVADYQSIPIEKKLGRKKFDAIASRVLTGTKEQQFYQIVAFFIPDRSQQSAELAKHAAGNNMRYLVTLQLSDYKGRQMAEIRPYSEDVESHLIHHLSTTISINTIILNFIYDRAKTDGLLTSENILEFLTGSCVIKEDRLPIVRKAVDAFLIDDYLTFIHLAIPQIEQAMRNLVEMQGGIVYQEKNGNFQLKTFDAILREETITEVLDENIQTYLRVVFVDQKGLNFRNEVMHGMMPLSHFNQQTAYIVFHCLLLLGIIRLSTEL